MRETYALDGIAIELQKKRMRALLFACLPALFVSTAPLALGFPTGVYSGDWMDSTFGNSGSFRLSFRAKSKVADAAVDLDIRGPFFNGPTGSVKELIDVNIDSSGSGSVSNVDLGALGLLSAMIDGSGQLTATMTNIPNPDVDHIDVTGFFDESTRTFTASYTIYAAAGGVYSEGTAAGDGSVAPVAAGSKPKLDCPKKVAFKGSKAKVKFAVDSDSDITNVKIKASGKPKVKLKGRNPYKLILKKLTKKVTKVKIFVTNGTGTTNAVVKCIRKE